MSAPTGTGGPEPTVTVALYVGLLPPGPVHISEYVLVAVGDTVWLPLVDLLPLQAPEAVQEVALVEFQVNVLVCPEDIFDGLAVMLAVGAGFVTVTVALFMSWPPGPVQVSV